MEMVATAKVGKAYRAWNSFSDYVNKVAEIVLDCIAGLPDQSHPYISDSDSTNDKTAIFVISSDMGLAGSYNQDLFKEAESMEKTLGDNFAGYLTVGARGLSYLKYRKKKILFGEEKLYDLPSYSIAELLINRILSLHEERILNNFVLIHSKFYGRMLQKPVTNKLLPIEPSQKKVEDYRIEYEFEPSPEKILNSIIPLYLSSHLLSSLLEAKVSELYARQNAMRNATENADGLISRFTLAYNKERQSSITQEIIEIVNGAEALKE